MSSKARLRSPVKVVVAIALVAVIAAGLGAGYYFASGADSHIVNWTVSPLKIKFSIVHATSGSAPDSFTCSPSVSPVTLQAFSSAPDIITITLSQTSFPTCGSSPDNLVVTAACTPAAIANNSCGDTVTSGTVVVCGPTPYTCLKDVLSVVVAVTTTP
jgi:hypothetical protein